MVFQDRFESRNINSDEYNFNISAYIHNNPHDIEGYNGKEETYKYSSYGIYLGIRQDISKLIDKSFIMELFKGSNVNEFSKRYCEFVSYHRDTGSLTKLKQELSNAVVYEYVSGIKPIARDLVPAKVMSYFSDKLMVSKPGSLATKARQRLIQSRAFTAYALRVLCGLGYRQICGFMCNMTISGCSRLRTFFVRPAWAHKKRRMKPERPSFFTQWANFIIQL